MKTTTRAAAPVLGALRLLAAALLLLLALPLRAHDVAGELRLHGFVRAEGDRLVVLLRVPLELLLNVDLPKRGNGYLDLARIDEAAPRALRAIAKDVEFHEDGRPLALQGGTARIALPADKSFQGWDAALRALRSERLPTATDVYWNQGWFDALLEYPIRSAQSSFALDFRVAPGLRERLKLDLRYLTPAGEVRAFELATGGGRVELDPRWHQAARTFVASGFEHILGGADHLLFLLCLVAPFRRLGWPLVGVVTAFTVAHSITLVAAAYGLVPGAAWFPPLVEALIAASILYMAVENVMQPRLRWRWLVTGVFGLVHGFGFSFGLANELQFAGDHLLLSLLAFNVGIELGQLLVLALAWPLLAWACRRVPQGERTVVLVLSVFVAHEAWHWLSERLAALMKLQAPEMDALFWARVAAALALAGAVALLAKALAGRGAGAPAATAQRETGG